MSRRKYVEHNIRKLTKVGGSSIAVTIPVEMVVKLGWRSRQRVLVRQKGRSIVITDYID